MVNVRNVISLPFFQRDFFCDFLGSRFGSLSVDYSSVEKHNFFSLLLPKSLYFIGANKS